MAGVKGIGLQLLTSFVMSSRYLERMTPPKSKGSSLVSLNAVAYNGMQKVSST